MSKRSNGIINKQIIIFLVIVNAIIIKTAFIGFTSGYWLLLITLPLLVWFIAMNRRGIRKEKPNPAPEPWGKMLTHLKEKVVTPGIDTGVLHQPGKTVAFGDVKGAKPAG